MFPCSPVSLFPCFLVPLFPCSPVTLGAIHSTKIQTGPTGKRGPPQKVDLFFSKLFRLDRTDPLSFGPKFPEILVEWIAPPVPPLPCSPVTLFPNESVESFPCSSVNLKFFTQMKRPHNSVNGRGIFTL